VKKKREWAGIIVSLIGMVLLPIIGFITKGDAPMWQVTLPKILSIIFGLGFGGIAVYLYLTPKREKP